MKANNLTLLRAAFAAFSLLFALPAGANIIYKDINPDITRASTCNTKIDIDEDGINELEIDFNIAGLKEAEITINTLGDTKIAMEDWHSKLFRLYDTINENAGWESDVSLPLAYLNAGTAEGPWPGKTDSYLGFSFVKEGKTLYGWMRVEVAENVRSFSIREIAFEDITEFPIMAGDKTKPVSAEELKNVNTTPEFTLYNRTLQVTMPELSENSILYVVDMSGKIVLQANISSHTKDIDLKTIVPGYYCVSLYNRTKHSRTKIFLK